MKGRIFFLDFHLRWTVENFITCFGQCNEPVMWLWVTESINIRYYDCLLACSTMIWHGVSFISYQKINFTSVLTWELRWPVNSWIFLLYTLTLTIACAVDEQKTKWPLKVLWTLLGTFIHKLNFSENLSVWIKVGKTKSIVTFKAITFSFFIWYIRICYYALKFVKIFS